MIGGGFSGALTALHLATRGVRAIVLEPGALGRGLAFADGAPGLLLNTPAGAMSALPDRPDDFVAWLGDGATFAPRARYGAYVREKLAAVVHVRTRAVDLAPASGGYQVSTSDGALCWARHVVLALGNAPPRTPPCLRGLAAYAGDPYRAMTELPTGAWPIALLGTGLTALDAVATLRARGHTGPILAISRRGLVPQRHPGVPDAAAIAPPTATTLAGLLAWWRTSVDTSAKLDALRPLLPALWRGLSPHDRARFVRHVRPHWETVRHRAPPAVHDHLASVEIVAGALTDAAALAGGVRLHVGARHLDVAAIINCTGPERDLARQADPLVEHLLRRGLVHRDPLGLGASWLAPNLHAVGPWRIATEWESTAVGELRVQAAEVARAISEHLGEPAPGALE